MKSSTVFDLQERGVHIRTTDGLINTRGLVKFAPVLIGLLTGLAEVERELIRREPLSPSPTAKQLEGTSAADQKPIRQRSGWSFGCVRRLFLPLSQRANRSGSCHHSSHREGARGGVVLRVLLGIAIGVFIYANPEARQITADLLRATGDALAPAVEDKTLQDRINKVLEGE